MFPVAVAILLVFYYPTTGLDVRLLAPFYDAHALVFPLKNDGFLENFMHLGLKNLMVVISLLMLAFWLFGLKILKSATTKYNSMRWLENYHREFLWVFIAMVISTSTVSILKHLSIHACPWDLITYGGTLPFIPLFGDLPLSVKAGHCFPGGHASGGFALMAFYFAFRDGLPKLAKIGLTLGLMLGFAMGWAQMMRGAHFMSHNLWTAWIVWMILLAQYIVWPPNTFTNKT
jgi:membrane-associated PAP2 superfamily phosphatase